MSIMIGDSINNAFSLSMTNAEKNKGPKIYKK